MEGLPQIRERILQNPAYLQQVLQELQVSNPQLHQLIQQNPQAMLQLLMGGGARRPRPGGIQVTPEEKAAIDRVHIILEYFAS
jgi:UV excision repair protein RAD23